MLSVDRKPVLYCREGSLCTQHRWSSTNLSPQLCGKRWTVFCLAFKQQKPARKSKRRSSPERLTPPVTRNEKGKSLSLEKTENLAKAAKRKTGRAYSELDAPLGKLQPFTEAAAELMQEAEPDAGKRTPGRGRGAKKALRHSILQVHKECFQAALKAELAEEWTAAEARLNDWPPHRLQEEGLALFGLAAEPAGALYRDAIIRLALPQRGTPLPFHNFSQGDIVLLSGPGNVEGAVMDFSSRWIRVAVPENAAVELAKGPWRMDLYINTTAHDRCVAALESFSQPPKDLPQGALELRKAILAAGKASELKAAAEMLPPWAREHQADIKAIVKSLRGLEPWDLNGSQIEAVEAALSRSLTLWQGPPGTGKTKTLLHLIRLATGFLGKGQVLTGAASNVGVDNIVGGLLSAGVTKVVRLGQPVKVLPELRAVTLEQQVWEHPDGRAAADLRELASKLPAAAARAARERALELEESATAAVLGAAKVVATTCVGAGDPRLESCRFRICALDEATQATEPASLIPLLQRCESAVLVGDQCQLPPTVVSRQAEDGGLGVSLFERLQTAGLHPQLLDLQYRMHPAIADFPSRSFYGGRVQSFPSPEDRPAPEGFPWPSKGRPLAFVQCSGRERRAAEDGGASAASFLNPDQAALVLQIALQLLEPRGECLAGDIAVITPYSGQVREIQRLVRRLPGGAQEALQRVEVRSVDGFQGREKEVIIFSTVRSNTGGSVGFLKDARRLNVALTRAKRGLVVIGDRETLAADGTWLAWLKWIHSQNLVMNARSPAAEQKSLCSSTHRT